LRYRDFGTTGLKVSELVFGGGAVGGLLINQTDDIKRRAVKRAMDAGINWIDTAPSYGQGRSEQALGWLLPELDEQPYISTKFTIDTRNLTDIEGQIRRSLEESLTRLQLDSVTLLQLHNQIGAESKGRMIASAEILKPGGVIECLEKLKQQGFIGHFGITALGETPAIVSIIESGRIESAQVYYNLLNPSAGTLLPDSWGAHDFYSILASCESHGVAPMNIRVFSAGVIATDQRTGREMPLTPGDSVESETKKATRIFSELGNDYGSRAQTAVRFALSEKRLACVIFGLAELDHLEEAISAQASGPLPDEAMQRLNRIYAA
jgi:L-galactose dehydrogenase/L-glyceraldehyde 3-phosphate reductase